MPKPTYTFKIPEIHFPLVGQCVQAYYADFVALLSKAVSFLAPENSLLSARYFYLRGLVHLMQGQLLSALLDFQNLYKTDIRIFPAELVRGVLESMSAPQRAQAERTPELRRLIGEVLAKPGDGPKADDAVKNFELPRTHLQLDEFVKRVQESGIVKDASVIHRLFEALTVGERATGSCGRTGGDSCVAGVPVPVGPSLWPGPFPGQGLQGDRFQVPLAEALARPDEVIL